jgi:sugar O-acyltransferase (sialic acid O-acetyltransferase NeuD family)
VVADIAEKTQQWEKICFLDDNPSIRSVGKHQVVGVAADIKKHEKNTRFFVAIGDNIVRQEVQSKLENQGFTAATLIHPNSIIASDVEIGDGTAVMAGVVINSGVQVGRGCIINTCSSVDHDCQIGDYVHISPGAHLAGNVHVGTRSWLGLGSLIINNLCICSDCTVGAGAVIIRNVNESGTYVGVPVRKVD